jgi:hypothetical protein
MFTEVQLKSTIACSFLSETKSVCENSRMSSSSNLSAAKKKKAENSRFYMEVIVFEKVGFYVI